MLEHERNKLGQEGEDDPPEKMKRIDEVASTSFLPPVSPMSFIPPMPGMVPYVPVLTAG